MKKLRCLLFGCKTKPNIETSDINIKLLRINHRIQLNVTINYQYCDRCDSILSVEKTQINSIGWDGKK